MRILRITMKNLNSLRGSHTIDLTREPLVDAGLFAITGPTGAGKTTILDAVTLALYGRAARYGTEPNPADMMSRHCGECSAEVEFEVSSGRYRAVWELWRARNKPDGRIQPPRRYLYDAHGLPLAEQIRDTEERIASLLGLNYERFLRSALLAQGDFARFLKARPNERAELLESLTGTTIYSRLSILTHEERGRREQMVNDLESRKNMIALLDAEERQAVETRLAEIEKRTPQLRKEIDAGVETLQRINALNDARRRRSEAAGGSRALEEERSRAEPDLERLRRHRLAVPYVERLTRLQEAETHLRTAESRLQETEKAADDARRTSREALDTLRRAVAAAHGSYQEKAVRARSAADEARRDLSLCETWLAKHRQEESLAGTIPDLATELESLKNTREDLEQRWTDLVSVQDLVPQEAGATAGSDLTTKRITELVNALLDQLRAAAESAVEQREKAARDLRLRQDHLEKAHRIARYEDQRHLLRQDEPCPLCGSREHPWADGAVPDQHLRELQEERDAAQQQLDLAQTNEHNRRHAVETVEEGLKKILESARKRDSRIESLETLLKPLGEDTPLPGEETTLFEKLRERVRAWEQYREKRNGSRDRLSSAEQSLKDAERELRSLVERFTGIDWDQDREPEPPGVTVDQAEQAHTGARRRAETLEAQLSDRAEIADQAHGQLMRHRDDLERALDDSSFGSVEELRTAVIENQEAHRLEELEIDFQRRATTIETLLHQSEKEIARLVRAETPEDDAAHRFREDQEKRTRERENLLEERTTLVDKVRRDEENRTQRDRLEKELLAARATLHIWQRLHNLIGSHDGSKFRRFAQTISLDILTRHANTHLQRLSDRYRIRRDQSDQLSLQIEDLHQAAVLRPMESLSGGESFLASLALALGLADLAGRTVQIDSLFIDEGFGSLDSDTLDTAISALESLQQNRKTVGVISHVALLKERISTQVVVEKRSDGTSTVRTVS